MALQARVSLPFTKNHAIGLLTLVLQLVGTAAFAQDPVPAAPGVLSNGNTESSRSTPRPGNVPSTQPVTDPDASATNAVPIKTFPFRIQSPDATLPIEIRSMYDAPIARCLGGCVLILPAGSYKVAFADLQGRQQELEFSVEGPGGVEVQDADEAASTVGLGLGVAGSILVVTGTALMVVAFENTCLMSECTGHHDSSTGEMFLGGLGAFAAGAIMTPLGWVKYARNRRARVRDIALDWSVVAAPTREGVLLGVTGRF